MFLHISLYIYTFIFLHISLYIHIFLHISLYIHTQIIIVHIYGMCKSGKGMEEFLAKIREEDRLKRRESTAWAHLNLTPEVLDFILLPY